MQITGIPTYEQTGNYKILSKANYNTVLTIASNLNYPIGSIIFLPYYSEAVGGFLPCNGQTVNTSDYINLANFFNITTDQFIIPKINNDVFIKGGSVDYTKPANATLYHKHKIDNHTHDISHSHTVSSHNHTLQDHNHSIGNHTHPDNTISHRHLLGAHTHDSNFSFSNHTYSLSFTYTHYHTMPVANQNWTVSSSSNAMPCAYSSGSTTTIGSSSFSETIYCSCGSGSGTVGNSSSVYSNYTTTTLDKAYGMDYGYSGTASSSTTSNITYSGMTVSTSSNPSEAYTTETAYPYYKLCAYIKF